MQSPLLLSHHVQLYALLRPLVYVYTTAKKRAPRDTF